MPDYLVRDLFAFYIDDTLIDATPVTRYQYQLLEQRFVRQTGVRLVADVTPEVIRQWKSRLTRELRTGSVTRYMKMLRAVLRVAVDELEWLPAHPMARVRMPAVPEGRVRFLTPEERVALLTACLASPHPSLYDIVLLTLATGGRKNEIRCLPWTAVDLVEGEVRFLRTKTKLNRVVPVLGDALTMLRARAATRHPLVPWVFPAKHGRTPVLIEVAWRQARLASGVQNLHYHDLRHTYASYLAMAGASLRDISELLGHKSIHMTMRYAHLMPSHLRGVVDRMQQAFLGEVVPVPRQSPANDPEGPRHA